MSDELFESIESETPPMEKAKRRFGAALVAFEEATVIEDDTGEPVPRALGEELRAARAALSALQEEAYKKTFGKNER